MQSRRNTGQKPSESRAKAKTHSGEAKLCGSYKDRSTQGAPLGSEFSADKTWRKCRTNVGPRSKGQNPNPGWPRPLIPDREPAHTKPRIQHRNLKPCATKLQGPISQARDSGSGSPNSSRPRVKTQIKAPDLCSRPKTKGPSCA